jgi:EpsI family protein
VALIGALSYAGKSGPDIHGPGHALQGLSVAVIGLLIMFATVHLLARRSVSTETEQVPTGSAPAPFAAGRMFPRLAITTSLVFAAMAGLQTVSFATPVDLATPITAFPANLGPWRAGPANPAWGAPHIAGVDSELSRTYVSAGGRAVALYAGYFSYQVQAKELVSERTSTFHQDAQPVTVTRPDGAVFRANESTQTVGSGRQYVLFWYDINGRTVANRYAAKVWTIWNSLSRRRNNGAVVMLMADLSDVGDSTEVIRETRELGGLASVALQTYLPR